MMTSVVFYVCFITLRLYLSNIKVCVMIGHLYHLNVILLAMSDTSTLHQMYHKALSILLYTLMSSLCCGCNRVQSRLKSDADCKVSAKFITAKL